MYIVQKIPTFHVPMPYWSMNADFVQLWNNSKYVRRHPHRGDCIWLSLQLQKQPQKKQNEQRTFWYVFALLHQGSIVTSVKVELGNYLGIDDGRDSWRNINVQHLTG